MITIKKGHFVSYLVLVAIVAGALVFMSISAKAQDAKTVFDTSVDQGLTGTAADAVESVEASSGAAVAASMVAEKFGVASNNVAETLVKVKDDAAARILSNMNADLAEQAFSKVVFLDVNKAARLLLGLVRIGIEDAARAAALFDFAERKLAIEDAIQAEKLLAEVVATFGSDASASIEMAKQLAVINPTLSESLKQKVVAWREANGLPLILDWGK